jgi:hypothetical protein
MRTLRVFIRRKVRPAWSSNDRHCCCAAGIIRPLAPFGQGRLALLGMLLWAVGSGAQDSLFKAIPVPVVPADKCSTAFGLFDSGAGIAWFFWVGEWAFSTPGPFWSIAS